MADRHCPICGAPSKKMLHPRLNSSECDVVLCILEQVPDWNEEIGLCACCLEHFAERARRHTCWSES